MKRFIEMVVLMALLVPMAHAYQKLQGWCERGGQVVVTAGNPSNTSVTKVQATYPSCTVTVYDTGTLNLSTIFSDNAGTAKANPFTADSTGGWSFYAANSRYDVRFSGGGISAPFTLSDYVLSDPATAASIPGGSNTQVQFNDGGAMAGDAGLTFNKTTNVLTSTGGISGLLRQSAALPATCTVGDYYTLSTDPKGQGLYYCSATNTWSMATQGVFNVKAYGAVGDGTTDDTAAIQAAITAACVAGGEVFFPSNTPTKFYKTTAALTLNCDGVTLRGGSESGFTMIKSTSTTDDILRVGDGVTIHYAMQVDSLGFGRTGAAASTAGYAVKVNYSSFLKLTNLRVYGESKVWKGFHIKNCYVACKIEDNQIEATVSTNMDLESTVGKTTSDLWIVRNLFQGNAASHAVEVLSNNYMAMLYVLDNQFYGYGGGDSTKYAYYESGVYPASGNYDRYFRGNTSECTGGTGGFYLKNIGGKFNFVNNHSYAGGGGTAALYLENVDGTITGNSWLSGVVGGVVSSPVVELAGGNFTVTGNHINGGTGPGPEIFVRSTAGAVNISSNVSEYSTSGITIEKFHSVVNTTGSTITWVSGDKFKPAYVNRYIKLQNAAGAGPGGMLWWQVASYVNDQEITTVLGIGNNAGLVFTSEPKDLVVSGNPTEGVTTPVAGADITWNKMVSGTSKYGICTDCRATSTSDNTCISGGTGAFFFLDPAAVWRCIKSTLSGAGAGDVLGAANLTTAGYPVTVSASGTVTQAAILGSAVGGTGNGFTKFTGPAAAEKTFTLPNASATILTSNAAVTVPQGGTGLTSGTSGGVPYFSGTTTIASSGALTAQKLVVGGGAGATPTSSLFTDNATITGVNAVRTGSEFNVQQAVAAGATESLSLDGYSNGAVAVDNIFSFVSSRGTVATPTALKTTDLLANIRTLGYGASALSTSDRGSFKVFAAEDWTDAAQGTYVTINTTAVGAATAAAERVRIDEWGLVPPTKTYANLGTPANGHIVYCSDCTIASPCNNGGTGAIAKSLNGSWICN